ncbi:hypothetical protein J6590_078277 [Homalodisca vitripennis]|nr:hypothetical protein J6590_078277 [Homalodisca vitripennis]
MEDKPYFPSLTSCVELEERQRNVELELNLSIVRRQLFQDVQDEVIIRNDDEEVDVVHEREHDNDLEESVSSLSVTTRQILPSSPPPPRGKAIGLFRGAVLGIPGRGLGVFRRPAGPSAEGAAGPYVERAPSPSPVGAAGLSAEGVAGRGRRSAIGQLRGAIANQR